MADISVIITAFNVERYISRAVHSALDQEGVEVQVIVIDDASSDQSWAAISAISDQRVKAQRNPMNLGPGAARNLGMSLADAPWIAILDGDDAFLPGRLQRLLQRAELAQADIVVDNLRVDREAEGASFPMFPNLATLSLANFIGANCRFLGGYTYGYLKPMFSAKFLRQNSIAYDPALRIGEDYLFLADALAWGGRCVTEENEGYLYTVRVGSTSHRLSPDDLLKIRQGDHRFVSRHKLGDEASRAQKIRETRLREAITYLTVVQRLERCDLLGAVLAWLRYPWAIRLFFLSLKRKWLKP